MGNKTQINKNNTSTLINEDVRKKDNATVINPESSKLSLGIIDTVINQKYRITKKLDVTSGEADLYICEYNSKKYVAKIYRREAAIKTEVVNALKRINSPHVAKLFDTGTIDGLVYEILPYFPDGSLQNKKISFEQLKAHYIPALNNGLKALHDQNIIHKDLKPSNIMFDRLTNNISIIDFGISSVRESGMTMLVTKTGMTPIYSAPETFRNVYLSESDYYSLGITLYELFTGTLPYQGLEQEDLERMISVQRIPLPEDMPLELKQLILGLTYNDISNRNKKNNPNRRWGYKEVDNWLKGIKQVVPGEGISSNNMMPFKFLNEDYTDIKELTIALLLNWDEGKKQLYRGYLSQHLQRVDLSLAKICMKAEQNASQISGQDDYIFWDTMYSLNPNIKDFYWQSINYKNLPALGRSLLEQLQSKTGLNRSFDSALRNNIISKYLKRIEPTKEKQILAIEKIENSFVKAKTNAILRRKYLYLLGYSLSGQKIMKLNNVSFGTTSELSEHMQSLFNQSFEKLQEFCYELINFEDELDPQFEAWLLAQGKGESLTEWKKWLKCDDQIDNEVI